MSRLSRFWSEWRAERLKELVAEGLTQPAAEFWSGHEAAGRQFAEPMVGRTAAVESDLVIVPRGRSFSMFLRVEQNDIPVALAPRAQAWAAMPATAPAAH